jgi:hypothetical protein
MRRFSKILAAIGLGALVAGALADRAAAHGPGWGWGGGWGWGVTVAPIIVPGPYNYPPQPYYAPPPAPPGYYAPSPGYIAQAPAPLPQAVPSGTLATALSCNAGNYICPMEANVPVGSRCYCRGNDGNKVYGTGQ